MTTTEIGDLPERCQGCDELFSEEPYGYEVERCVGCLERCIDCCTCDD